MRAEFDVVVVGAGAAGCVVASRLSEVPGLKVALVESGRDYGTEEPEAVRDAYARAWSYPKFLWPDLKVRLRSDLPPTSYSQGHMVGGGSAVMGMHALRGLPDDYDEWERLGASGWGWSGVKSSFLRLEQDLDYPGPNHGHDGPMPIWRQKQERLPPFARAVAAAFRDQGFEAGHDVNAEPQDGVFPMPFNATEKHRATTAWAYLGPEVRRRPELTILADTRAMRVLFEGRRVIGLECAGQGERTFLLAREVVLCCGALQTPVLLMRSGIGPRSIATENGIRIVSELSGVGRNLLNHPILPVAGRLRREVRHPRNVRPHVNSMLRYSSGVEGCPPGDMYVAIMGTTAWHSVGQTIGALALSVYKSFSRGMIDLRGAGGLGEPSICLNILSDERDRLRMAQGLGRMLGAMSHPAVAPLVSGAFLPSNSSWIRRLSVPSPRNWLLSAVASMAMDRLPGMERCILEKAGRSLWAGLTYDELDALSFALTSSMYHPVGTCRLGEAGDAGAVALPDCTVKGVFGLSIADASLMPTIPRANTFLSTVMIGEKAAELIRDRVRRVIYV